MEKKQKITISIVLISITLFVVIVSSGYKTNQNHKKKLYSSMEAKIIENGLKCYNEEKCTSEIVTLQELYDKEYLNEIINPLNNEYINPKSYVEIIKSNEGKFIIIDE